MYIQATAAVFYGGIYNVFASSKEMDLMKYEEPQG
jgi:succinate-acetate transporter protein